ncbi:MAG: phosphoglucosamine mutase [Elusimicrobia bacterium RIFOXYA2_FULL_39_19]|nr:MAG: phosphoglucosamine mutase [Elusimicrobia bacterium RIFOXYA2_FULL_39_19]
MKNPENLKVTVSGVRGVVGDTLTPELILNFTQAFGTYLKGGKVILGRDTRPTGPMVKHAVLAGLVSAGCEVIDIDICATPTVLMLVKKFKAAGGIIITASHNPVQWNALKFVNSSGVFLTETQIQTVINLYEKKDFVISGWDKLGSVKSYDKGIEDHINKVLAYVDINKIKKSKFKVALDCVNGAGSVMTPFMLNKLGCKMEAINMTPDGIFPHTPEPVPENLKDLCKLVKSKKADIGFAQDPDADRLAIIDELGNPIGEEYTLAVVVDYLLSKKKGKVVINLSTSRASEDIAKKRGAEVIRTKVGEANVVEGMIKHNALIGGEGNGGVIFPSVNFGRDSFVGIALVLQYMAETKKTLSEIVASLPKYKIVKTKLTLSKEKIEQALTKIKEIHKNDKINTLDGIKIDFENSWVHLRASNTEPIVRIVGEAPTTEEAAALCEKIKREME